MLSTSSLLSIVPCETSGGLSVGCSHVLPLHFLRSLNGFDVFIKNHSCETDICTFVLVCDLITRFSSIFVELEIILKELILCVTSRF